MSSVRENNEADIIDSDNLPAHIPISRPRLVSDQRLGSDQWSGKPIPAGIAILQRTHQPIRIMAFWYPASVNHLQQPCDLAGSCIIVITARNVFVHIILVPLYGRMDKAQIMNISAQDT